jgi:hypothetical protein
VLFVCLFVFCDLCVLYNSIDMVQLMQSMDRIKASEPEGSALITGKVISILEGGYDTSPYTLGLAKCVDAHVLALQQG